MQFAAAARPPDLAVQLTGRLRPGAGPGRAATVRVADAADVLRTVRWAGRHGVPVGISGPGSPPAAGRRLLVDLGDLDAVTVSAAGWARVGAGTSWRRLQAAAARHGLAPVAGARPTERVADSVTGGGVGPVARTYGLVSDRVRAVDLVTGDGVARSVTPAEHPELFWGVRGGGAALGVVTAVELDLLAAGPVWAGELRFGSEDAARVLQAWAGWSAALPAQAGTSLVLARARGGFPTVSVRFSWTGDPQAGAGVLEPLRGRARPVRDDVRERPRASFSAIPGELGTGTESSLLLDRLPPEAVAPVVRAAHAPGTRLVELRLLGGAVSWAPELPSAVCHRDARLAVRVAGDRGPGAEEATRAVAEELLAVVGPEAGGRAAAHGAGVVPDVLARTPTRAVGDRLSALAAVADPHGILDRSGLDRSGPPAGPPW
jgi:FAD/FMN-containing dehydrogenase